jgi:hypothetical protein
MNTDFWKAYSNDERHSAIDKIQSVVSKYGDIIEFKFFSDISITLIIEIIESKIGKLNDELRDILTIDKYDYYDSTSQIERTIYLNITFTKGTGNLKIEVPSVPG